MKQGFLIGSGLLVVAVVAATAWLSKQTVAPLLSPSQKQAVASRQITDQRREPISIASVREPDEMLVEPFAINSIEPTAPERELAEATNNFSKVNLPEMLPVLDRILANYPDFAEGYVFRLGALCDHNDLPKAISDINNALKFMGNSRLIKETSGSLIKNTSGSLLSMRAKLKFTNGDYATTLDELEKVIRTDLSKAAEFTNSGAAKPEKTASICVWTESDMDALVQRFPSDYRSHMFRGLYFSFFVSFSTDDSIVTRAVENFEKAAQLSPQSALPQLFKARLFSHIFVFYARLNKLGGGDTARANLDTELVSEYSKALALDPNLVLALEGRANALLNLKQFQQAIADYNRILSLDPQDGGAYHDRALAKMELGRNYEAISDFSSAIKLQPRELLKHHRYESRADAYMKTRQWDLAIRDLTTAISLEVGGAVLLMNVDQFRSLYPEYKTASNEMIARKLHQTFYPNLKYEGFANGFFGNKPWLSTVIPDLYLKRSDAYLKKGDWHRASIEFRRAIDGFPDYASSVDRWRDIGQTIESRNYIDFLTFEDASSTSIKLWTKEVSGAVEADNPYILRRFELNCGTRQLRPSSFANCDASGHLIRSRELDKWQSIVPETFGETLYNGACRSN